MTFARRLPENIFESDAVWVNEGGREGGGGEKSKKVEHTGQLYIYRYIHVVEREGGGERR